MLINEETRTLTDPADFTDSRSRCLLEPLRGTMESMEPLTGRPSETDLIPEFENSWRTCRTLGWAVISVTGVPTIAPELFASTRGRLERYESRDVLHGCRA